MEQRHLATSPFISVEERAHLVHCCAVMSRRPEVAEDLAQEALLEAWRHQQTLRDPMRRSQWLVGIARNVCLRWWRKQGRDEAHRFQRPLFQTWPDETDMDLLFVDDDSIELNLERKELLDLLDRALALLPIETRTALIRHYIDESPLTEVAQQLSTNTNALAVRLQRGKLTLRRLLTQELAQEFATHRQLAESTSWEVTPVWCYHCGSQRLLGRRISSEGKLWLKCPVCTPQDHQVLSMNELPVLLGMKSYKPMLTKIRDWCHGHYWPALAALFGGKPKVCELCGQPLLVYLATREQLPGVLQEVLLDWQLSVETKLVSTFCPHCQSCCNTTLSGLVLSLPEARTFAQTHARIRTLPVQSVGVEGRPALLTRMESVTENLALNVICDEETYAVLRIEQVRFC